jgi:AraC-like DNA-binding protein
MIRASMSQLPPSDDTSSSLPAVKVGKYEKSGLTEAKAKQYLAALQQLMESEKPYTNSELTLLQLAEMLVISPHNLSEIINTQLQLNFFDFVNGYRVEKARRDLIDPTKQHLKILSISFEAGFISKTAFNTIFKKFTNLTPSEYRQRFGSMGERGSEGEGGGGVDA